MYQKKTMLKCADNQASWFTRLKMWAMKRSGPFSAHPVYAI